MKRKIALLFCAWTFTIWCAENRTQERRAQQSEVSTLIEAFQRGFSPACPEEIEEALAGVEGISVRRVLGFSQIATCYSLERDVQADEWGKWAQNLSYYSTMWFSSTGLLREVVRNFMAEESGFAEHHPIVNWAPIGGMTFVFASRVGKYFSVNVQQEWQKSRAEVRRNNLNLDPLFPVILDAFRQNPTLHFSSQRLDKLVLSLMQRPQGLIVE